MVEGRVEYAALCFRAALDGDAPKRLLPFLVGLLSDALESRALRLLPVEVLAGVFYADEGYAHADLHLLPLLAVEGVVVADTVSSQFAGVVLV